MVQVYQYAKVAHAIVGGAYRAHLIDVSDKTMDEVIEMMDNCIHRKHDAMVAEVQVAVLTFQRSSPCMCPYFVLVGRAKIVS